jgi:hypothetical protein
MLFSVVQMFIVCFTWFLSSDCFRKWYWIKAVLLHDKWMVIWSWYVRYRSKWAGWANVMFWVVAALEETEALRAIFWPHGRGYCLLATEWTAFSVTSEGSLMNLLRTVCQYVTRCIKFSSLSNCWSTLPVKKFCVGRLPWHINVHFCFPSAAKWLLKSRHVRF